MDFMYHPSAYRWGEPCGSWWEDSADHPVACADLAGEEGASCDIAVIGGGYTGLSAALHLSRDHGADVRVVEAGWPGWGASGRNGGFSCMGMAKLGYETMTARYGLDETRRFHDIQKQAVGLVAELIETEAIDAERVPDGDIWLAHKPNRIAELRAVQRYMKETFGEDSRFLDREELGAHGIAGPEFHAGLRLNRGFGLHPLKYCQGLARAAQRHGAVLYAEAPVTDWLLVDGGHVLVTPKGELRARTVIVATNGYTAESLHRGLRGRLLPVLSNILVTRPLSAEEQAAQGWTTTDIAYDSRKLLHYVRLLPDGRYLFGGRGGASAAPEARAGMRAHMEKTFRRLYPAWADVEFTHFWNGFVCMAYDLVPHLGNVDGDRSVWCALAYHGSGVAGGTWTGRLAAALATGSARPRIDIPLVMQGPPPRFTPPFLRSIYLRSASAVFQFQDRFL